MIQRIIFLLIALNSFLLSNSQTTFNYIFKSPLSSDYVGDIAEHNGNYYAIGGGCINAFCTGTIYKITKDADTLTKTFSFGDSSCMFINFFFENNKVIIVSTIASPPDYYEDLMIIVLDSNLNYLQRKIINLPYLEYSQTWRMKKHQDSYYILTSTKGPSSTPPSAGDPYFIKLNSQFDTIRTYVTRMEGVQKIQDFLFSKDGTEIYLFSDFYFRPADLNYSDQFIVYDTAFNFKYYKVFPSGIHTIMQDVEWFNDSTIIMANSHGYPNNDQWFRLMDTTLAVLNQNHVGVPELVDHGGAENTFDFINTDSIYFAGVKNVIAMFFPTEYNWIRVGILNKDLQLILERYYGGDAYYVTRQIKRTSDGGFLISAQRYDYLSQQPPDFDICILKLNKEGLITNTVNKDKLHKNIIVYPNPTRDYITIESTVPIGGKIQLFDCNGKIVMTSNYSKGSTVLNISTLTKGVYFLEIQESNSIKQFHKIIKL